MSEMQTAVMAGQIEQSRVSQLAEWASKHRQEALAVASGLVIALGAAACGNKSSSPENASAEASAKAAAAAKCGNLKLTTVAFGYANGKFLPKADNKNGISSNNEAAEYSQSLFDANGPLSGTAGRASLAVIDAAIAHPALQKNTNNSYSYTRQFDQDMKKLRNPKTAQKTAVELCEDTANVLGQTVGYDDSAIAKGEQYTTFTAIAGKNDVVGLRLDHKTADNTISGATFEVQNQESSDLHGITEVIIEADGTINVKGYLPTGGEQTGKRGKGGKKPSKSRAKAGSQGGEQNNNGRTQSTGNTGSVGSTGVGNSQREQNTNTGAKENRPNGNIPGARPGPAAGKPNGPAEAQPGPGPSPSGGGGETPSPTPAPTETTPTGGGGGGGTPPPPAETTTPTGGGGGGGTPPPTAETKPAKGEDPGCPPGAPCQ